MMNLEKRAGESRRSRRLVYYSTASVLISIALLVSIKRMNAKFDHDSWSVNEKFSRSDAEMAQQLLQNVNGANAVLCGAVERAFFTGTWGMGLEPLADDSVSNDLAETSRWIGKDKIDRGALDVARGGLASSDACTRRVAAHIAGNIDVERLDEKLDAELSASAPATRAAAVSALGYAEQHSSIPRLKKLISDSDRKVRLTALWALGRMEDSDNDPMMINLLKSNADPDVRRIAAWALGKSNDR